MGVHVCMVSCCTFDLSSRLVSGKKNACKTVTSITPKHIQPFWLLWIHHFNIQKPKPCRLRYGFELAIKSSESDDPRRFNTPPRALGMMRVYHRNPCQDASISCSDVVMIVIKLWWKVPTYCWSIIVCAALKSKRLRKPWGKFLVSLTQEMTKHPILKILTNAFYNITKFDFASKGLFQNGQTVAAMAIGTRPMQRRRRIDLDWGLWIWTFSASCKEFRV